MYDKPYKKHWFSERRKVNGRHIDGHVCNYPQHNSFTAVIRYNDED